MPIYEYECTACGHRFETIQKHTDKPLTDCPKCGKSTLEKCISATHFQLKGKGWYETDYKNKPAKEKKTENTTKPAEKREDK